MKRKTQKEIMSEYGIEKIGDKNIMSPIGKIPFLLVNGNEKIGKNVYHFSTLPGSHEITFTFNDKEFTEKGTCNQTCIGCYGFAGNYTRYGFAGPGFRTIIARYHTDFMVNAIIAQIKAQDIKYVRIHATGDFFSTEYVNAWKTIIENCKDTTFWTYTKNPAAENAFNDINNVNIVRSLIPGYGFNFGHCDYVKKMYNYLKSKNESVYICRCGIDKNQHCTNCKGCSKNKYVLFIEHSTDYKAEKDPLFEEIKNLIEAQPAQF